MAWTNYRYIAERFGHIDAERQVGRPAVVFLIDDDDYIIADDFEVDVPEFIHERAWFQPAERGGETP